MYMKGLFNRAGSLIESLVIAIVILLSGCSPEASNDDPPLTTTPADTYFSLAVTENSHNHVGARLLFLDFQETVNTGVIQNNIIISPKSSAGAFTIDGNASEWNPAQLTTVNGLVQNNYPLSEFIDAVPTAITIGSSWDDSYIYFLVRWVDAGHTNSSKYKKWIYGDQGNLETGWNSLNHIGVTIGDLAPNEFVVNAAHTLAGKESEDRVFFMFPIADSENNFSNGGLGCAAYCHANLVDDNPAQNYTGSGVVAMHTNVNGDMADVWHWKSSRTHPSGYADDKYINYAQGSDSGRRSDAGTSAYSTNVLNVGNPTSWHTDRLANTDDFLMAVDVIPYDGTPAPGHQIPANISNSPTGSRADVEAQANFNPTTNQWTLEIRRLRNTGNADDRQFPLGLGVSAPGSTAPIAGVVATGASLYSSKGCVGCHGAGGIGNNNGITWSIPRIQRASGSLILKAVQNVAAMQSLNITETEAEDIAAYLQTQSTFVTTDTLLVNVVNATGAVTSNPAGVDCASGSSCTYDFISNSTITLSASYVSGYTYAWSGVTCGELVQDGARCTVSMTGSQNVTMTYTATTVLYAFTVNNGANGTVNIAAQGDLVGTDCNPSATCILNFSENAEVTLTPSPDPGYRLANWSGDCSGTGSCVVTMSAIRTVTATYELIPITAQACTAQNPLPAIPGISMQQVVTGFFSPVHVTHAGDGSGRLFVVEQRGTIRVVQGGSLIAGNFLDIRDRVSTADNEMGLLSIAFHPDFASNNKFYVNYTSDNSEPNNKCSAGVTRCTIISEFTIGSQPILEDSETVILEISQPDTNHNGGQIAFGPEQPDPYLYIGMGDGGGSGDNFNNGQDLTTLHGAMLRIDINNKNTGLEYAIPSDNPLWTGVPGALREIWSYGLRNPWRFSFDPLNGDLYAGDVGQGEVEEIDIIQKETNYGWNPVEGDICYIGGCNLSLYEAPIIVHTQSADFWFSITGGVVYRGSEIPDLCGVYLYGDYVAGTIRGLHYDGTGGVLADRNLTSVSNLSSFGYDENYEVYALNHGSGTLFKVSAP